MTKLKEFGMYDTALIKEKQLGDTRIQAKKEKKKKKKEKKKRKKINYKVNSYPLRYISIWFLTF